MKNKLNKFFEGRQGMDELSKALFWSGLVLFILSLFIGDFLSILGSFVKIFAIMMLVYCFIRAFSRKLSQRDAENYIYINWISGKKRKYEAYKDRRSQSKGFKFFKCPSCGAYLRVPKGKGNIHIKCKCSYTLYRRT